MTCDFQKCGMCDQQSLRSACAYAQSDQSLCSSLDYYMSVKLLTEHHLVFLSLKRGCTGSSESTHVKLPHCWKSHVAAHMYPVRGSRLEVDWLQSLKQFFINVSYHILVASLTLMALLKQSHQGKTGYKYMM